MAVMERYGATIEVVSTGAKYHTWSDWGLTVTNGAPIGDPEQETNYITVPGRSNLLDASETLTGDVVFRGRAINMQMAIVGAPAVFDLTVSRIRNLVDGRKVKITFDNDRSHYWLGRINIKDNARTARLGAFTMSAYVDAYKHDVASSQEKLRWDDMNFLTDCLRYIGELTITGSYVLEIPKGDHAVVPTITVRNMTSQSLSMAVVGTGKSYNLVTGDNRFPDLKVCGPEDVTLSFGGSAKVKVSYRGESL